MLVGVHSLLAGVHTLLSGALLPWINGSQVPRRKLWPLLLLKGCWSTSLTSQMWPRPFEWELGPPGRWRWRPTVKLVCHLAAILVSFRSAGTFVSMLRRSPLPSILKLLALVLLRLATTTTTPRGCGGSVTVIPTKSVKVLGDIGIRRSAVLALTGPPPPGAIIHGGPLTLVL